MKKLFLSQPQIEPFITGIDVLFYSIIESKNIHFFSTFSNELRGLIILKLRAFECFGNDNGKNILADFVAGKIRDAMTEVFNKLEADNFKLPKEWREPLDFVFSKINQAATEN